MKMLGSTDHNALIHVLKDERMKSGLRQIDLANRLGVHQSFVSKYEVGERRLDILELREICQAFGLSLGEFVERLEMELRRANNAS